MDPAIARELNEKGVVVAPLPEDRIVRGKPGHKSLPAVRPCRSSSATWCFWDTGHAKLMTPYFPLEALRLVPRL